MQWLWPDADGDAVQPSFDSTLYRPRRLIGIEGVIVLSEGRLFLDAGKCWVDVGAFDELVNTIDQTTGDAS